MTISRRKFVQGAAAASSIALAATHHIANAQTAEFQMKWASNIPVTHPTNVRVKEALDLIRKDTNGKVDIQLFPNNQLGGDTDMLSQVRSGAIDFFPLSGLILQTLVPVAGINGVAFAFKDYATVWAAMDGDLGAHVRAAITKANLYVFDKPLDNGYRDITSSTRPIVIPDDLKGFKIRVPVSPLWTSMFKALDASPASINFSEVYSALQSKVVDGQENPLALISTAKLYEVQKFCSLTNHMWDGFWFLGNGRAWEKLPADLRIIVARQINAACMNERADLAALNTTVQKDLAAKGMVFNAPKAESFRDQMKKAGFYSEWKGKFGDEAWAILERSTGKLA